MCAQAKVKGAAEREPPADVFWPMGRTRHAHVPIEEIFRIEFEARGIPQEEQKAIRMKYEEYASGLVLAVRGEWPDGIGKADEKELFMFLSEIFYSNFKASYDEERMLVTSIPDNRFNCYSSSILMADVLSRLGKNVSVVIAPGHMFLKGREWAFETAFDPEGAVVPNSILPKEYPERKTGRGELLLASAYCWCGSVLNDAGRREDAIMMYDRALEIWPKYADVLGNKGDALASIGRLEEAADAYSKAVEISPEYVEAWRKLGKVFQTLGDGAGAAGCLSRADALAEKKLRQ